jgi:EpsI family protein
LGTKRDGKLAVLAIIFLITTIFVHGNSEPAHVLNKPSLQNYFQNIEGYNEVKKNVLNDNAVQMLKLDDYAFLDYEGPTGKVNLYIGYYYTANKAYASHSPLVCYPSQGWQIENRPVRRSMTLGPHKINYEEITTSYGGQRELVMFWYQTHGRTSTQVYRNKVDMALNRLTQNDEQHAFVRVSVPMAEHEVAERLGIDFTSAFFPRLVEFFAEHEQGRSVRSGLIQAMTRKFEKRGNL